MGSSPTTTQQLPTTVASTSTPPSVETDPSAATPTSEPRPVPPAVDPTDTAEPFQLTDLGERVWLIQGWERASEIVRTDTDGVIVETLWSQDIDLVQSFLDGHTVVCDDHDGDGETDLIDVRFSFEEPLKRTLVEVWTIDGDVVNQTSRMVDGANVPSVIYEVCGQLSMGPFRRLTAMQWGAALDQAGFTDIAGDHAIDPVWEAGAKWNGTEYWPLNLFQGDVRPETADGAEVIECEIGAIMISRDLPTDARQSLISVAGC